MILSDLQKSDIWSLSLQDLEELGERAGSSSDLDLSAC